LAALVESCIWELCGLELDGTADGELPKSTVMAAEFPKLLLRLLSLALFPSRLLTELLACMLPGAGLALATGMRETMGRGRLRLYMPRSIRGSSRNLSS
jgi:hypothetical protein